MPESFDPYRKWLGIPPEELPPHHYRLLGIAVFEDDPDVIAYAADRQMTHVRKFQSGQYSQHSQKMLNELAQARLCLLNLKQKAAYDERLRGELGRGEGGEARTTGVAAPRPTMTPVSPKAPPTMPPPASPPQPAPPRQAPPQSAPPVATLERPTPMPVAKSSSAQPSVAVRTGPMAATARRSRKNSQGPLVVVLCVMAGLGLLAVVLTVALDKESGEDNIEPDNSAFVAQPPPVVVERPQPAPRKPAPPVRDLPVQPPKTNTVVAPPGDDSENSDSNGEVDKTPPPNLNDPQRTAKMEDALAAAKAALASRDLPEAQAQIEIASALEYSDSEKQQVADLQEMHALNEQFWQAVDRAIKRLKNGDEVTFQSNISNFVSADEEEITLLITGTRVTSKRKETPVPYLIALAERGLQRGDPHSQLVVAAFLAVDNRDPSPEHLEYARQLLAEAGAAGAQSEALTRRLAPQVESPSLPQPGSDPAEPN